MARQICDLAHALRESEALSRRFAGKLPAVFLDYDGTLAPIRDRPEEAVISEHMREAVRRLAERVPVIVVSSRDCTVLQKLIGIDNLTMAASHGFDIGGSSKGSLQHEEGAAFADLLRTVVAKLCTELTNIPGALIEPKKSSVAVHFRLVPEEQRPRVKEFVDSNLCGHQTDFKVTPGKMVFEIQPKLDWDTYRREYGNLQRLDRILRAQGKHPDRYKVSKQVDAVLLFYLFRQDELKQIFECLGYVYTSETMRKTVAYYDARTTQGSTLSFVTYAGVYSEIDLATSWERYMMALESDVGDVQGGTTAEGIHMGVMAGTLALALRSYMGEMIRDNVLYFNPKTMDQLHGLTLPMRFRGLLIEITLEDGRLRVAAEVDSLHRSVNVGVGDHVREIRSGESHIFDL
jgi:trehalose-phosphatase